MERGKDMKPLPVHQSAMTDMTKAAGEWASFLIRIFRKGVKSILDFFYL